MREGALAHDTERDRATERFLAARLRILGLAYRMLGTLHDAEDVVQEAYERWHGIPDREQIDDAEAFLVTVTTRLCIDQYRRERARRETYPGPWLPEPVVTSSDAPLEVLASERLLGVGLLRLMERLGPLERAVFVLSEGFDYRAREIAAVVERSEVHCRQLLYRARRRLESGGVETELRQPSAGPDVATLLAALVDALARGAAEEAARLLAEDVTLWSDGGGEVSAVTAPVLGDRAVARLLTGLADRARAAADPPIVVALNGVPSLLLGSRGAIESALIPECRDGRLRALYVQRNPRKLTRLLRWYGASSIDAGGSGP